MDATQYGESDFITTEIVNASKTKKIVVIGDAKVEETDWGSRMELPVEIDGKKKRYRPNKDTIKNCIRSYGVETKGWLGKTIALTVMTVAGKDSIIGSPQK
jgi:hypothetical protein